MSNQTLGLPGEVHDYLLKVSVSESILLRELREETASHSMSMMQIAPEQGQFMSWFAQLLGVKRAIEVGVFTGYSSLWLASAMGQDGYLLACDISEEYTAIAGKYWGRAGLQDNIDLRIAPAVDTLDAVLGDGGAGSFDLAFIDADKSSYRQYYEKCLELLKPSGVIIVDNVLWGGDVADESKQDEDTIAIRELNALIKEDKRVSSCMIPVADGLMLVRKL